MRLKCRCKKCGYLYELVVIYPIPSYCPKCGAGEPEILEKSL